MDIFPAIDIRHGRVVRSSRTDPDDTVVYHDDPFAVAEAWLAAGARWLHVVDLDRAFAVGDQSALVAALAKRVPVPVQAGGGLWQLDDVLAMRDAGVQRVVLGARATADQRALAELVDCLSDDCLALAVDGERGRAWARDWDAAREFTTTEVARRGREAGIRMVVLTDLAHEGGLRGANVPAASAVAADADVAVIVSGGVGSLADLADIRDAGLAGAVVGRALFDRRFSLEDALACCSPS